jgi:hypothetical protein
MDSIDKLHADHLRASLGYGLTLPVPVLYISDREHAARMALAEGVTSDLRTGPQPQTCETCEHWSGHTKGPCDILRGDNPERPYRIFPEWWDSCSRWRVRK